MQKRPLDFNEYIGQVAIKFRLKIEIEASIKTGIQLRHIMLSGPSGLGKTSLAKIISAYFGKTLVTTTGPAIKNLQILIAKIKSIEAGGFIFIDEIHKLNKDLQEYLLVVLEDFEVDEEQKIKGNKSLTKTYISPFTLIGATTRLSDVDIAFRERFGIKETLEFYSIREIYTIIRRYLAKRNLNTQDDQSILEIAYRSRQTPRIALSLTDSIISYAQCYDISSISLSLVEDYFKDINKINKFGLTETDLRYLRPLLEGPLSLKSWANKVGEKPSEIEEVYEPYYVKIGFVRIGTKGRLATEKLLNILSMVSC